MRGRWAPPPMEGEGPREGQCTSHSWASAVWRSRGGGLKVFSRDHPQGHTGKAGVYTRSKHGLEERREGGSGTHKCVYQNQPNSIFPFLSFIFSR